MLSELDVDLRKMFRFNLRRSGSGGVDTASQSGAANVLIKAKATSPTPACVWLRNAAPLAHSRRARYALSEPREDAVRRVFLFPRAWRSSSRIRSMICPSSPAAGAPDPPSYVPAGPRSRPPAEPSGDALHASSPVPEKFLRRVPTPDLFECRHFVPSVHAGMFSFRVVQVRPNYMSKLRMAACPRDCLPKLKTGA